MNYGVIMKKIVLLTLVMFYISTPFLQANEQEALPPIKLPEYIVDPYSGVMANAKEAFFVYKCARYGSMQNYFGFAEEGAAKKYAKKNNCGVLNYEDYKKALKKDNRLIEE